MLLLLLLPAPFLVVGAQFCIRADFHSFQNTDLVAFHTSPFYQRRFERCISLLRSLVMYYDGF